MQFRRKIDPRRILAAVFCAVSVGAWISASAQAPASDNSKEPVVIEKVTTEYTFASDGTRSWEQNTVVRVQSEAGVRQFGVLTFPYSASNEKIDRIDVRVRKADGRVVETPAASVQDLPAEAARSAPTYSDLREKQVPVKGLARGDVLEYRARSSSTKAEVPGQFWMNYNFVKDAVALEETLRVAVPGNKFVNVKSATLQPAVHEENGQKVYIWKSAQLQPTKQNDKKEDQKKEADAATAVPSVQLTTFKSWEEVGEWYRQLAEPRTAVTDAIRAQAAELTKGLTSDLDRKKAIYNYVSTKFRYIGVSFGLGRYQPHTAEEVLTNGYGDCKDKHTLLAALLKAVNIEAWPALINAGTKPDESVPSPGQFNHLITVIPEGKQFVWLDTTPEVAPYRVLQAVIRDQQALVIPASGKPALMKTPADLPFPVFDQLTVKGDLSAEGTFTGHIDYVLHSDSELILRSHFHQSAPSKWQELVQGFSYRLGFAGTVSSVDVENLEDTDKPFHLSYDYERKEYTDWAHRRITPPFPPVFIPQDPDAKMPAEPFTLGSPGEVVYRCSVRLPEGFTVELPGRAKAETDFAGYSASYAVDDGVLSAERRLTIRQPKAAVAAWPEYVKLGKAVLQDTGQFLQLTAGSGKGPAVGVQGNAEAEELVRQGFAQLGGGDLASARKKFAEAERLNPRQRNLWFGYGTAYGMENQIEKAVEAYQKELQYHPDFTMMYHGIANIQQQQLKRNDDAIATLRALMKVAPGDADGAVQLAALLSGKKNYSEAADVTRKALEAGPDNLKLQVAFGDASLRAGRKEEGVAALRKVGESAEDGPTLNSIAWALADTSTEPALARTYAEKSVSKLENDSVKVSLNSFEIADLQKINSLGAAWDTLGWVYFRLGELDKARQYVNAAWILTQEGACADHLGQIYEAQGKRQEAQHAYELALAARKDLEETYGRLRKLDGEVDPPVVLKNGMRLGLDELGNLRTTAVPGLEQLSGSGEFFILLSAHKVEDVQFINGVESLSAAKNALAKLHYAVPFPDDGPEKIVRRGILSCSKYTTPHCQFVLLLPANTTK